MDNNNNEKKTVNKRAYIAAIICIAAAIIAIVAISLAVGLTRDSSTPEPSGGDPTITIPAPDDNEEPDDNDDKDDSDEPDEPTVSTPTYALPLSECVVGNACSLDELVWSDTLHWYATHNGTDFVAEEGTPVLAASDGTVTYVGYSTQDGYTYTYRSDCPLWAFWSNENGGDYVCVEPWWGINDNPAFPRELSLKPFMNFEMGEGSTFSYELTVSES